LSMSVLKSAVVIDLVNLILSGHRNCCKNTAHTYIFRLLGTEKRYTKKSVKNIFLSFKISIKDQNIQSFIYGVFIFMLPL
jgi:hypothetical protein